MVVAISYGSPGKVMICNSDSIDRLVTYAAELPAVNIPRQVMDKTKQLLLDTIGCMLAGSSADGIRELKQAALFWGGNPSARIFGFDDMTTPPEAACINSAMAHAHDYDDTHDEALNHGCVTLVPALLALCDGLSRGSPPRTGGSLGGKTSVEPTITGREFTAALAIGLDVANRIALTFIRYLHVGWLPTTLSGPFACAAACGRILGLDRRQMYHAFGFAYARVHGNRQALADGALAKRIQPGFSASAGLRAALYACHGLSGARNIIDGEFGMAALYTGGRLDAEHLTDNLGTIFETSNVSVKPYPSCRCTHPVIDAALRLAVDPGVGARTIKAGTISLPPASMGQIGRPFRVGDNPTVDAQFNASYTAALAFTEGRPKLAHFRRDFVISRRDLIELAGRFRTVEFEKHRATLVPIEMRIELTDGKKFEARVEHAKGSPAYPATMAEIEEKFDDCLDTCIKAYDSPERRRIKDAVDSVLDIENIGALIACL